MSARGYFAVFTQDGDTGQFEVAFPGLAGCVSVGDTFAEAAASAQDALETWLEASAEHGYAIPDTVDPYEAGGVPKGARVVWVPAAPIKSKTVVVSVSMSERALQKIDAAAVEIGLNRSTFIAHAALAAAGAKASAERVKIKGRKRVKAA
jgi:predicted RNase H-like HicB family nuclease